jgi:hypothetical protein
VTTQEEKDKWEAFLESRLDVREILYDMLLDAANSDFVRVEMQVSKPPASKPLLSLPAPKVIQHDT